METSREIDVANLDAAHRRALEEVIGSRLQRNQRLIIRLAEIEATAPRPPQLVDDWTKVYEGLSDEQIASIDRDVTTRANLTRHVP
jgi:hypothetical protein